MQNEEKQIELSPIMEEAIRLLKFTIKDIRSGRCSEEDLTHAISKLRSNVNAPLVVKEKFCDADTAMRMLGTKNRSYFFDLMKHHNVPNHRKAFFKASYLIDDIERVKEALEIEKHKKELRYIPKEDEVDWNRY